MVGKQNKLDEAEGKQKDLSSVANKIDFGSVEHLRMLSVGFKTTKDEATRMVDAFRKDATSIPHGVYQRSLAFLASFGKPKVTTSLRMPLSADNG